MDCRPLLAWLPPPLYLQDGPRAGTVLPASRLCHSHSAWDSPPPLSPSGKHTHRRAHTYTPTHTCSCPYSLTGTVLNNTPQQACRRPLLFLPVALLTFGAGSVSVLGGWLENDRLLSSTPGLHSQWPARSFPTPSYDNQKRLQALPDIPWGQKHPQG